MVGQGPRRLLPLLAALAWGCSETLAVHVIRQPDAGALAPRAACELHVYGQSEPLPDGCREVGDVFVGDTGLTTNCGRERVLAAVHDEACRLGADATQVIRAHEEGAYGSSCYQVRARFLACPAPEASR